MLGCWVVAIGGARRRFDASTCLGMELRALGFVGMGFKIIWEVS